MLKSTAKSTFNTYLKQWFGKPTAIVMIDGAVGKITPEAEGAEEVHHSEHN
ncbi:MULTISPECIES: hypothetical protein [Nitrosomonas]|uniref:Uncharacterized protein n=1 Tax=Nitrosomonas communis TaxID=44574 RepID=A0A5D3YIF2_9PROT|nr:MULTISPECIES: hypothetical protein [Nitrosomonas]TYP93268.1 hypothetical protein BCL69_100378 [Nitrosomonas communis]UVS62185.1 hypothetical protein NX761_03360 [Nitrosomonas sp. PLL12]